MRCIEVEVVVDTVQIGRHSRDEVAAVLTAVELTQLELSVFGNDYKTPDGTCIRDYINVVDLAQAHIAALKRLLDGKVESKEIFNLGTGEGTSVLELINKFELATGVKVPYDIVGRRAGDIEAIWADPQKANKILKWKTEVSLEDTLLSAWNWQRYTMDKDKSAKRHFSFLSVS